MAIRSDEIVTIIKSAIDSFDETTESRSVGTVVEVGDGIAQIYGLEGALASELLEFPGAVMGMALNLEEETVGAVILGNAEEIKEGDTVKTTGRVVEVPVGPEQIGSEMAHDGVFSGRRNELDHRKPVSDDIMIIGAEYGTDFIGRSAAPTPPAKVDLPDTIHPEVCVQRELVAQPEQLMLAARGHLTHANPGQIGRCQGRHAELGSGQHAAGQHLVQPLACPPNGVSLRHSLIVTCCLQQLAS